MKKYFSLIAVAMIAVSSVFTSCNKDDEGSSFCPQVTTESSVAANQASAQTATNDSLKGYGINIVVSGFNDTSNMDASRQEVVNNIRSFFQAKVGSYAKMTISDSYIHFDVKKKDLTSFNNAIDSITKDELREIVKKTPAVNVVRLDMFGRTQDITWNIVVKDEPDESAD